MKDDDFTYGFEHWMELHKMEKAIRAGMVEIPEGYVTIAGKTFHVGAFKIARALVSEARWGRVMGTSGVSVRKPITGVSFVEISDFLRRLTIPWKGKGHLSIPTEAQIERARQYGAIRLPSDKYREICLTHFRAPEMMGKRHYVDNLPREEPFDLVVRSCEERSPLRYDLADEQTGFRLALVDYYMSRPQVSSLLSIALDMSDYNNVYVKDGREYCIYFEYSGDAVKVCPPNPRRNCLLVLQDQERGDEIIVSTDVIRLPQDMDPDAIKDRLNWMNALGMDRGIQYKAPFLYHPTPGVNRAVLVEKQLKALSDVYILAVLPAAVDDVLAATAGFNQLFFHGK